jgi:hypothetical protein
MAMVRIRVVWIRMKLMHWIDLQIQSIPRVLCSVISKNNNQKSKNHDTFVWSLYVKSEGNEFWPILAADFSDCAVGIQSGGVTADDGTCTEKFRQDSERSPCMLDPYEND